MVSKTQTLYIVALVCGPNLMSKMAVSTIQAANLSRDTVKEGKLPTNCLLKKIPRNCHMTLLLTSHWPELSHMVTPSCKVIRAV